MKIIDMLDTHDFNEAKQKLKNDPRYLTIQNLEKEADNHLAVSQASNELTALFNKDQARKLLNKASKLRRQILDS